MEKDLLDLIIVGEDYQGPLPNERDDKEITEN